MHIYDCIVYGPLADESNEDTHRVFLVCEGFDQAVEHLKERYSDPMIERVVELSDSHPVVVLK